MFDPLQTTIGELQDLLNSRRIRSQTLVETYLDRIETDNINGLGLRAILETAPRNKLLSIAKELDIERDKGKVRGPLHGIPLIVKDAIGTGKDLGMQTTAGSRALQGSVIPAEAFVIKRLREAGAIILAKANMSELGNFKSPKIPWAYSDLGGQCSSAYVKGGFVKGEGFDGPGNPSGSSSGSAVGLSAGFAAASLGTDARGSLCYPAHRAALFGICPTRGLVSRSGVVPMSISHDTVGVMGFSAIDTALLLETIAGRDPDDPTTSSAPERLHYSQYALPPHATFKGMRLGIPRAQMKVVPEEISNAISNAARKIAGLGATVIDPADMLLTEEERKELVDTLNYRFLMEFPYSMDHYLKTLVDCKVKTAKELAAYNEQSAREHGETCYQDRIEAALAAPPFGGPEHQATAGGMKSLAGDRGLVELFDRYNLDAVITSVEKANMTDLATCTSFPAGCVPLGYKEDGEPFGLMILTRPWQEPKLISLMAAFEANFPHRRAATRFCDNA